jgi:hypothetical protein
MVITWNTDPSKGDFDNNPGKFSSYYQYDTETRKMVRIRLELNRSSKSSAADSGSTKSMLNENRAVGFSSTRLTKDKTLKASDFKVDDDKVLFRGEPMSQTPQDGYWVVDMSQGSSSPHLGNMVTTSPNLPEGIQTKHLSLLANQAIIDGEGSVFTAPDATADDLSKALKAKVTEIMGKPFDEVTDADLLAKLTAQVTTIREQSTQADQDAVTDSLQDVDPLIEQLNDAIENGLLTPNQDLTAAFDGLQAALVHVDNAMDTPARTAAIEDLQTAHDALVNAMYAQLAEQADEYEENLDQARSGIEAAQQASERMDAITAEYETTEQASSIEDYEKSMNGVEANEAI